MILGVCQRQCQFSVQLNSKLPAILSQAGFAFYEGVTVTNEYANLMHIRVSPNHSQESEVKSFTQLTDVREKEALKLRN